MNNVNTGTGAVRNCTGCSVCFSECPTDAINIKLSDDGFYEPIINEDLCINCGKCKMSCYKFDTELFQGEDNVIGVYSSINTNDYVLNRSSSGGISDALAKTLIANGYIVLGSCYDYENNTALTISINSSEELHKIRGSKYFQSNTVNSFKSALSDTSGQKYAVFGTPCQIYALSKYLNHHGNRDNFLLIDIFCHGTPSLNLWEKYLNMIKSKMKVNTFDNIEFRSKALGWHKFCFKFSSDNKKYITPAANNPFYTMFFDKNAFNLACYDCKLRSTTKYTDIRLGDFWGSRYDTDKKGVSAVIICSEKADNIFKNTPELNNTKLTFDEVINAQSYGRIHDLDKETRRFTLDLLKSDMKIEDIIKVYRQKWSNKKKTVFFIKGIIKSIPLEITGPIKKIYHKILF